MIYGSLLNVEIHLYEITNKIEGPVQIVEQVLLQMYVSSYLIVAAKSSSHIVKYNRLSKSDYLYFTIYSEYNKWKI